jgi:hypothetical protein
MQVRGLIAGDVRGTMVQVAAGRHDAAQGASPHAWLEGHARLDPVTTLDDATSAAYFAVPVAEVAMQSSYLGLASTFGGHGPTVEPLCRSRQPLPPHTRSRGKVIRVVLTQVGRADFPHPALPGPNRTRRV